MRTVRILRKEKYWNEKIIEKSTGMLRKNDPKGLMVMGSDLPWDLIRELPVPKTESIQ